MYFLQERFITPIFSLLFIDQMRSIFSKVNLKVKSLEIDKNKRSFGLQQHIGRTPQNSKSN